MQTIGKGGLKRLNDSNQSSPGLQRRVALKWNFSTSAQAWASNRLNNIAVSRGSATAGMTFCRNPEGLHYP
jgi:hypothetical protein